MDRFIFFVFLLCPLAGFGQLADCYEGLYCRVAAPSGLKLREQPNIASPKVTTLPYGSTVLACRLLCENCEWDSIDGRFAPWVRVAYGEYSGYAYSAYLDTLERQPQFGLLKHWFSDIAPRVWLPPDQEFTGLYTRSDGSFYLKKMNLLDTVVRRNYGPGEPERVQQMLDTVGLVAFFANVPAIKPRGKVTGILLDPENGLVGKPPSLRLGNTTYALSTVGVPSGDGSQLLGYGFHLRATHSGQTTERTYLNLTLEKRSFGDYDGGIYPYWMGDLDSDGRLDMILSWSGRLGSERVVVLLSSAAEQGHFFKEVCFYMHDCC